MHLTVHEASLLVKRLDDRIKIHRNIEVVLAPNFLALQPLSLQIDHRKFSLCAQNAYYQDEGAFTGEVSYTMLRGLVRYCLIGHSERRIYFNETNELIRNKVQAAVRNGIRPVICVGETKHERLAQETKRVIHDQVVTALSNLTAEDLNEVVIAYEPVWAISTFGGQSPAKPDEIETCVKWIRQVIEEVYGQEAAAAVRIIYGASVEPEFVSQILKLKEVEGLLPGAASLNYLQFSNIVEAVHNFYHQEEQDEPNRSI